MTIARRRGASALAKAISRRLLPDYLPLARKLRERRQKAEKAEAARHRVLERLKEHAPSGTRAGSDEETLRYYESERGSITATVSSARSVRLEMRHLPPGLAGRLLAEAAAWIEAADALEAQQK